MPSVLAILTVSSYIITSPLLDFARANFDLPSQPLNVLWPVFAAVRLGVGKFCSTKGTSVFSLHGGRNSRPFSIPLPMNTCSSFFKESIASCLMGFSIFLSSRLEACVGISDLLSAEGSYNRHKD